MAAIMDLSFPGQRPTTATSCIPHDSVYMPGPHVGKSKNGFFRCDTWLQIFQNDSKICEAEVIVTPLINKIWKPCFDFKQFNKNKLWYLLICVSFALFNYSSLSYIILALSTAATNLPNKTLIFHDFQGQKIKFHDFPGLENEILAFHDFPGFLHDLYEPCRNISGMLLCCKKKTNQVWED